MRRRALVFSLLASPALAQGMGPRPLRIVVPFPPGGGNDIYARLYAGPMGALLGTSIVVENRSGASGNLGAEAVAHAATDGHTMLYASATIAINPHVLPATAFNAIPKLLPMSLVVSQPFVMVARAELGVRSIGDLLERQRRAGMPLAYGSAGVGGISNLLLATMFKEAGIPTTSIHYRGAGPLLTAMASGEVQVASLIYPLAKPFLEEGRLVPLAVTGATAMPQLPSIPTLAASGFPHLVGDQWHGMFLPAQTPLALARTLQQALATTIHQPAIVERMQAEGATPVGSTPEAFAAFFQAELARWGNMVRTTGVSASD